MSTTVFLTFAFLYFGLGDDGTPVNPHAALTAKYRVEIQEIDQPGNYVASGREIRWVAASPTAYQEYRPLIARQLHRYPTELVQKSGLKRIVICDRLTVQGRDVGGCSHEGTIWLSVGVKEAFLKKELFHHEFFHVLEMHGVRSGLIPNELLADWESLSSSAADQSSAKSQQEPGSVEDQHGFITSYVRKSAQEDRAETYSYNLLLPNRVARLAISDPIIKAKAERIKQLLTTICPEIGEHFWANQDGLHPSYDK